LKEATAQPPRNSLRAQQRAFQEFRQEYNYQRPHEALNQQTPSTFYPPSPREYPERLPDQRGYPEDWQKRTVKKWGQVNWKGTYVRLCPALYHQQVGFEPIDDGIWAVHFEHLMLGIFDERKARIKRCERLKERPPNK
jgi:putative transposase